MREVIAEVVAGVLDEVPWLSGKRRDQLVDELAAALCSKLFDLGLLAATSRAVEQARAENVITAAHEGVVVALLQLARRIDLAEPYFDELSAYNAEHGLRPPSPDNVSMPTYLKYSDALGLTPKKAAPGPAKGGRSGGGLANRRAAEQARQQRTRQRRH